MLNAFLQKSKKPKITFDSDINSEINDFMCTEKIGPKVLLVRNFIEQIPATSVECERCFSIARNFVGTHCN